MINDSIQLESLFSKSFLKQRKQQMAEKINIDNKRNLEYFDIDDPDSIIDSFNTQIDKIKQMCIGFNEDIPENATADQIKFDFPSKTSLIEIMKYLQCSINTKLVPADLIMNSIIFIFLDKILQNDSFYENNLSAKPQNNIINQVTSLYASISLYDFCEPMNSIIDKYTLFLLNPTNKPIGEDEKVMFIVALSNLLIDEDSRNKLLSAEIHNIIFQIMIHPDIAMIAFSNCLHYLTNFTYYFDSKEKNNTFFTDLLQFLIGHIIAIFSPKLEQSHPDENEDNLEEHEAITLLIKELKLILSLLDPLIESALSFELENCIRILFLLANSDFKYNCLSESLFRIMKLIAFSTNNKSPIFSDDSSFLEYFLNIYMKSSNDAKCQGIELLIILSSSICNNTDFFHMILQNFNETVLDNNFELWEHITHFIISILKNADSSIRRELIDPNLTSILRNSFETKIFLKDTLKLFFEAREGDQEFWEDFLFDNFFMTDIEQLKDSDFENDPEIIELINLIVGN